MGLLLLTGVLYKVHTSDGVSKESVVANLKVIFGNLFENNKQSGRKLVRLY